MKSYPQIKVAYFALVSLSFVVFLGKAYETSLRSIDSNIHAKISMEVTSRGFIPQLPIPDPNSETKVGSASFNNHPFFYFWMNGWIMRALGPSAWSARVLTAVFSTGCVIATFLLGMTMYSRLFGFISALFFLFTRDIILTGTTVSLDPPMLFFILLSFLFWQNQQWLWVGLSVGIGLWIKSPVVLLVFPTAILVALMRGQLKVEFPKIGRSIVLALSVGSIVWIVTGLVGGWELVGDYWIRQLWGTAITDRNKVNGSDWFMFFRVLRNGFLPGLPFLMIAMVQIYRKRLWQQPVVQVSLTAIGILILSITPKRFNLDYSFNPVFPFLALLTSFSIFYILKPFENRVYAVLGGFAPILMAILLCTPISLGPEPFVALKRFIPLIQSYGECDDEILLIPGGEPIGSTLDYSRVLNFYTGRTVNVEGCESVGVAIRNGDPQWVILSQENYDRCLTRQEQVSFKTCFTVGNQYLLTNLIPESTGINLTPFERELKPVIDCRPQAYPKDIYHRY